MRDRHAENLGVCRMLMFGFACVNYGFVDFAQWANLPAVFWNPLILFRALGFGPPTYDAVLWLQWIFRASLVLSCAGLFSRVALPAAGLVGTYLIAIPNHYGHFQRTNAAFVLALLVMACSRAGDAWSLDALLRTRRRTAPRPAWRFEYQWPVLAIRVILAVSIFSAGASKLRRRGMEWFTTDSLAILLDEYTKLIYEPPFPSLAPRLVAHPWLCSIIATGTVITETFYPLAMISRTARFLFVPGIICMLLGIRAVLGPNFIPLIALQLFWVDWSRVLDLLRARRRPAGARIHGATGTL